MKRLNVCDRSNGRSIGAAAWLFFTAVSAAGAAPLGTAFTYQGRLSLNGAPVSDTCDLVFSLFDEPVGGNQVGPTLSFSGGSAVAVSGGLLTVELDFGPLAFDGERRWLQIDVACPSGGTQETLTPRQPLTAAPYARFSASPWQTSGSNLFYSTGNVGIGTNTPSRTLSVEGNGHFTGTVGIGTAGGAYGLHVQSSLARAVYANSTFTSGTGIGVWGETVSATGRGVFGFASATSGTNYGVMGSSASANGYGGYFLGRGYFSGQVGIGSVSSLARLEVEGEPHTIVAYFNRTAGDGPIIGLQQDGTTEGTISVSGTTVSYNAFTGSHYAWVHAPCERGMLVSLTGVNRRLRNSTEAEIVYGVVPSKVANDPRCLGAYMGLEESSAPASAENPHLVAAVGNGDLWVVDTGRDIEPGDALISSYVTGHAMLDDPAAFETSHVVARAAEPIAWSEVTGRVDGNRHRLISVLFEPHRRSHTSSSRMRELTARLDAIMDHKDAQIATLRAENQALAARLERIEKLLALDTRRDVRRSEAQSGGRMSRLADNTFTKKDSK